jgi:aspartyl-tRNA(Asn)/glutamyl-tRNA(Gln) amidotransferase subunit A
LIIGAAAGAFLASGRLRGQSADPTTLTIDEAAKQISSRRLSPTELTRAYLERIEKHNPSINAYITVTAEAALAQARALEAELARGRKRGPLHGIPIALKDNIDTAGVRTTAASALFAERVPTEDATVVRRLRDAGAVVLGKLNMHEFAFGGTSAVSHFGPVRNPWDVEYCPGGSSGGSGAAVAARLCAAALGTDTAASVRMPAAFCGVVGLKATYGLASIRGIVPLSETHDHVGPLCRSVGDSALMLTALAGFDPLDATSMASSPVNYFDAIGRAVAQFRIGIPREPFFAGLDPEIGAAVDEAIAVLRRMTRSVTDVTLPTVNSVPAMFADIHAYHASYVADPERRKLYQPLTLERILEGAAISVPMYIEARRRIAVARNIIAETFMSVDVLVTPTTMVTPPKVAEALVNPPSEQTLTRNTMPFNALGIPTISVPCGFTPCGACRSDCRSAARGSAKRACWRLRTPTNRRQHGISASPPYGSSGHS